jgi:CBS domain-containing protein
MKDLDCGMLAVLDSGGRLAGVLTDRTLALACGERGTDPSRTTAGEVMTHHVHTCDPDDDLHVALERMAAAHVRRLPVVDAQGNLSGMIGIDDVILWGIGRQGVSIHQLVDALRRICALHTVRTDAELPHL